MPRALATAHESLLHRARLQIPDKVTIVAPSTLLRSAPPPWLPAGCLEVHACQTFWWGRVVRRAGLESDGLRRVEVAGYSLDRGGDAALLLLHRGSALPRPVLLSVQVGLGIVGRRHLHRCLSHTHLAISTLLPTVRGRRPWLRAGWSVHVVVPVKRWWLLWVPLLLLRLLRLLLVLLLLLMLRLLLLLLLILHGTHRPVGPLCCCACLRLGLSCLGPLLAQGLGLYLLLCTGSW